MTAEDILKSSEKSALDNNQIVSHVNGKVPNAKKIKKTKSLGVLGFIMALLVGFAVFFSSGNLIPSAVSERLIEETDVQYADAVESKKLVFQQALYNGDLPENTIAILKQNGVEVEKTDNGQMVLKMNNKTITADTFITEVNSDVNLYNAFNNATYDRAAYYYDESAKKVFKKIGTNRNNYTSDSSFDEVMDSLIGKGSKVEVNNVVEVEKEKDGKTVIEYESAGEVAKSSAGTTEFINKVGEQNLGASEDEATLNSADSLKTADTISKEQRSSLFFLAFMENISKMKAGDGNDSKINEAMNYLYENSETEVVDVKTGEIIKTKGTAMDSPSLYAILSGNEVNLEAVGNYSSDRILETVKNRLNTGDGAKAIKGTVASSDTDVRGLVGRFLNTGGASASLETLNTVSPTIDSSLINNSYKTIKGVNAGEFLVEGAVNVGKELAKASGATAGDAEAANSYAKLNSSVLAMDAEADRINRSPFDVTSKNTFMGSIFYKLAVASKGVSSSIFSLNAKVYADGAEGYLTKFGECETYATIGAVGSPQCAEIATFDTSTLNDPFNDPEFIAFVNNNTTLDSSGSRKINEGSVLANFILYNNERVTPLGIMDGGILDSLNENSSSVPFMSDALKMIKNFMGASDSDKRIASGEAYVNSKNNPDWQTYKYAQRYVSLARATESLRQFSGDSTAYNNIKFFEGGQNPVVAFLEEYYEVANE